MTLFTGSSKVAEKLAVDLKGRIKLEDAGFDWKILGPDVNEVSVVSYKYYLLSTIIFCVDQGWFQIISFDFWVAGRLHCLGLWPGCICMQRSEVLCTVNSIHAWG